jgi:ribonuclease R
MTDPVHQIKALLARKGSRVLSPSDIFNRLAEEHAGDPSFTAQDVARRLDQMERDGTVVAVRGKHYSLLEYTPFVAGVLRSRSDGSATVRVGGEVPDIAISRNGLRGAMNGDFVLARADRSSLQRKRGRGRERIEGEVVRILRREHQLVVGRFHDVERPFVRPFDIRLDTDIEIDVDGSVPARDGEMVNVEITRYGDRRAGPAGRIVEALGMLGEPGVDIEVVLRKHHIPHAFPDDVTDAAETIPLEVDPVEIERRTDLRDRVIVTIDGETAKDFDDAVEVSRLANGNFELGVHIADVAHYVTDGSPIDREAFERGTSVYFPGRAVPMLPERLSNGICSLNPRLDRLTLSVFMEIDPKGRFVDQRLCRSVIRTRERMTYTDVNALLTGDAEPAKLATLRERYAAILDDLGRMRELFEILNARRNARGSIDFDLPQSEVLLTEAGEIETIQASERNVAHRLIEEFMLAANEVVARTLIFAGQPGMYRVHPPPDALRMADLKELVAEFGLKFKGDPEQLRPADLQRLLDDAVGRPEERFINELILRSMTRAIYSEENTGHFALALENYCHFTSPIRRYPDLVVHRRLTSLLEQGPMLGVRLEHAMSSDPITARQASNRERRAEDAEREVLEWKKVIFMRDKVGNVYAGRVAGVLAFGLFVELDDYFVQGLVPVASIGGDYWLFVEREHRLRGEGTGRELRLGDAVLVAVRSVDEDRRQIEFRLVEAGGVEVESRRSRAPRGRR